MKAEKKRTAAASDIFQILSETWKARRTPFLFEKRDYGGVITGYKSSLLPRGEIPSKIQDCPIKKIGARAFLQCGFLEEVSICDGIEEIEANAFSSCERLTKIHMADSVRIVGRNAFFECESLFDVKLSSLLESIESRAFFGCVGLRDLALPDSLESIGEQAFFGCRKLRSIRIPLSLRSLPRNIFDGCVMLDAIYLEKGSYADSVLLQSDFLSKKLRYIPRI